MTQTTVTIAGREFRIGAWYACPKRAHGTAPGPKMLKGWNHDRTLLVAITQGGSWRYYHPSIWAVTFGDEVKTS